MHKSLLKINIIGFISIFLIVSILLASRSYSDRSNVEDSETKKVSFEVQPYNPSNKIVIEPLNLTYD